MATNAKPKPIEVGQSWYRLKQAKRTDPLELLHVDVMFVGDYGPSGRMVTFQTHGGRTVDTMYDYEFREQFATTPTKAAAIRLREIAAWAETAKRDYLTEKRYIAEALAEVRAYVFVEVMP